MKRLPIFIGVVIVALVVFMSSLFIVDEREKALVLQFGQIKSVKEEPGLAFKIPFIQEVVFYDDRILSLDTPEFEVTPSDDRRLVVDAFARYRIADVVRFRQAVGSGGIRAAEDRLEGFINPQIRAVLGSEGVTSNTILSSERATLMSRITEAANRQAQTLGIEIVDVRLKQTNLPDQNLDATFARMRAEREREAADERARGEEAAQRVRAQADRTVVELESDANRQSEIVRGEADAERNRVYADAYGADEDFFEFYRSLEAYRTALKGENTTMVLSPDSAFFDYLKSDQGLSDAQSGPQSGPESGPATSATSGAATGTNGSAVPLQ
ncbi:Modulator of FtsH protease HflC [Aquimixticola soesokkakensis]|uniref:Protein HflC n=1 Tax=Aquimixticola soesokkakensis TaxID=1519096 RepID=A0A1Y5S2V0_9RHOB|nr:protease modulator HflC [Aquimixticola soesokkakensis]SLN31478.1 Modulator of FtsH protease HflC [Aquimixticola soesokkakensis]